MNTYEFSVWQNISETEKKGLVPIPSRCYVDARSEERAVAELAKLLWLRGCRDFRIAERER